jgi:hypothetical protein
MEQRSIRMVELFLHTADEDVKIVEADLETQVSVLVEQHGGNTDVELWLEDVDEPLARERTLHDCGVEEHDHVHLGRKQRIEAFVRFGGDTIANEFGPSTKFKRVYDWSTGKDGFRLTADQRAKHVFELTGTDIEPEMDEHIGRYAHDGELRLDIVPTDRHAG